MIPDHLIDKAETAAIEQWGRTGSWDAALIAALEAVAADIWEQGAEHGALAPGYDPDDNPYRASEGK